MSGVPRDFYFHVAFLVPFPFCCLKREFRKFLDLPTKGFREETHTLVMRTDNVWLAFSILLPPSDIRACMTGREIKFWIFALSLFENHTLSDPGFYTLLLTLLRFRLGLHMLFTAHFLWSSIYIYRCYFYLPSGSIIHSLFLFLMEFLHMLSALTQADSIVLLLWKGGQWATHT